MEELKPCPFCGGRPEFIKSFYGWMSLNENGKEIFGDNGMIRCTQCGIRTRETRECDVIEAWNRRADQFKRMAVQLGYEKVVHCKDCRLGDPDLSLKGSEQEIFCNYYDYPKPADGFCEKGKMRTDE